MAEGVWPSPRDLKSWTDSDDKTWRRIGVDRLGKKAVRRLIHDPSTRVVLFYGLYPSDVNCEAREGLWSRSRIVTASRGQPVDPFADFVAFMFRDVDGNVMLAIEEFC